MNDQRQIKVDLAPDFKGDLNEWIYNQAMGVVQTGPFKGMRLSRRENWHDGNLGCKILGCYESELHECVENEIKRLELMTEPKILDIGCAEGFYAVGMLKRMPYARMTAFDIDPTVYDILNENAVLNGVVIASTDIDVGFADPDLVICDCEAAEVLYLDKGKYPALAKSSIIVECHDFGRDELTECLINQFTDTHDIYGVDEGGRNPNEFQMLQTLQGHARWLAVSEGRPFSMHWLYMVPK